MMSAYPYLTESCAIALLGLGATCLMPEHRKLLLLAGLLNMPNAIVSSFHVPAFWQPKVLGFRVASLEDVIWLFGAGLMVCFAALLPVRGRVFCPALDRRAVARLFACLAGGHGLFLLLLPLFPDSVQVMFSSVIAMFAVGAILVVRERRWIPMALCGSAGYTVFHVLDVKAFYAIWPETRAYWTPAAQLPFAVLGVPAWEVIWAAAFGFVWPLVLAFGLDLRVSAARRGSGG
jgi:hypothetical protein